MSWLLDMNREEREEQVILLYKEGRTFKDIAKKMHISFRDIGAIINKAKLQVERERGYTNDEEPKSPESKAFKLFSEGKSPVEVAIALDQPGDRTFAMLNVIKRVLRESILGRCLQIERRLICFIIIN